MANFLGNMAIAREGAFFKKEQEADLQRYIEHLKKKGIISKDTGNRSPPQRLSLEESIHHYEVLGEILKQGARLNIPNAALLQEYEKRIKAKMPPLSDEEFWKWKTKIGMTSTLSVALSTSMRLQSNRYANLREGFMHRRPISPEAAEAARRQFMVAMRGLFYGSVGAGLLVATMGVFLCRRYDVRSVDDVKPLVQKWISPVSASLQTRLMPLKQSGHRWTECLKTRSRESCETPARYQTAFSKSLKRRLKDPRRWS